jgi:glycosyltransferase involved in cell wall biosynthesis
VISDNDSTEDVAGYVESLRDRRIVYARTSRFVPVTENWNAALALSSGDYVLMLGDDDGLLAGYIRRMVSLVDRFGGPDLVYTGAFVFTYPGVDPKHPSGFLAQFTHAEFFRHASGPFVLSNERALSAVRKVSDFRLAFHFNMQLSLVSRRLIERVQRRGAFFQSPFPDYYATCAAFVDAELIVADPHSEVVIGVTPKSYGFFHLNDREQEGRAFLEADRDAQPLLPGSNINDGWLGAMEALAAGYGPTHGIRVNRRRYRMLQAMNVYSRRFRGGGSDEEVARLEALLGTAERLFYRTANLGAQILIRLLPHRVWSRVAGQVSGQFPNPYPAPAPERYRDVLDVFERIGTRGEAK